MQQRTLGDFQLTHFTDGNYFLDGGAFFGVVPKALWERKLQAEWLAQSGIAVAEEKMYRNETRHAIRR